MLTFFNNENAVVCDLCFLFVVEDNNKFDVCLKLCHSPFDFRLSFLV